MTPLKMLEWAATLLTIGASVFAIFFVLETRHASKLEVAKHELEKAAQAAYHYRSLSRERELLISEQQRLDFLEGEVEKLQNDIGGK